MAILAAISLAGLVVFACENTVEETTPDDIGTTATTTVVPLTNTPPPNPFLTDTGIRITFPADFAEETGATPGSGYKVCEADARVLVQDGRVVRVTLAPPRFTASPGEQIYRPTGEPLDDPTLLNLEVYRNAEGKLIAGWRQCQDVAVSPLQ